MSWSVVASSIAGGVSVTIASGTAIDGDPTNMAANVAVNATGIYWGAPSGIQGVLKGGAATTIVVGQGPENASSMTVDDSDVYWLHSGDVMKAPLSGGPPITLATGQDNPGCIVVDATSVYWGTASQTQRTYVGEVMKLTPK
jgi:hypothetical protein